jgi:hypothetical protein
LEADTAQSRADAQRYQTEAAQSQADAAQLSLLTKTHDFLKANLYEKEAQAIMEKITLLILQ